MTATNAAPPRTYGWKLNAGLIAGGVGALGLMVGSIYSNQVRIKNARASKLRDNHATRCEVGGAELGQWDSWCASSETSADQVNTDGKRYAKLQWVSYGVGGVLALTGVSLILWDIYDVASGPEEPNQEVQAPGDVEVGISPAPGGGMVMLGGRF